MVLPICLSFVLILVFCDVRGGRIAMMCPACGAEMHLMQMDRRGDLGSLVAFERHTFKCSVCPQLSQRLVFSRPSLPDLPVAARTKYPLAAKPQTRGAVAENTLAKVAEKLRSRRMVTQARASAEMAPISQETFDKLQGQATPVQELARAPETRPVQRMRSTRAALNPSGTPARASTWAEVVEKVRTRQIALKNRAVALSPAKKF
jgi:hypothetical protein